MNSNSSSHMYFYVSKHHKLNAIHSCKTITVSLFLQNFLKLDQISTNTT